MSLASLFQFRRKLPSSQTPVQRQVAFKISRTGGMFLLLTAFMCLAAVNSQANLLFGVTGLMVGVWLAGIVIRRLVLRRMSIRRIVPESGSVGDPIILAYECHNAKRFWPSLSVTIAELEASQIFTRQPITYLLHAAPRHTALVRTHVIPKRRGMHVFGKFQTITSFPFGLARRSVDRIQANTLLIYPPIGTVDPALLALCRAARQGSSTRRPRQGGHDEFYGMKEFRAGDNPRWIHWRRSAKTGVLVSKEMTHVAPPLLLLLVDTCTLDHTDSTPLLVEKSIAMAATLAVHAMGSGMNVGLCAWSDSWISMEPGRGKRHQRDLLSALARLPLNRSHSADELLASARSHMTSDMTCILFTPAPEVHATGMSASGIIAIGADTKAAGEYFSFPTEIDFAAAGPPSDDVQ